MKVLVDVLPKASYECLFFSGASSCKISGYCSLPEQCPYIKTVNQSEIEQYQYIDEEQISALNPGDIIATRDPEVEEWDYGFFVAYYDGLFFITLIHPFTPTEAYGFQLARFLTEDEKNMFGEDDNVE